VSEQETEIMVERLRDIESELATVRAENAELRDRVAALEATAPEPPAAPPAARKPAPEARVGAFVVPPDPGPVPSEDETRQLMEIVRSREYFRDLLFPTSAAELRSVPEFQFVRDWRNALAVVPLLNRTPAGQLNDRFHLGGWLDQAGSLLQRMGRSFDLDSRAFLGACLVHGVEHNLPPRSSPREAIALGLMPAHSGRRADPLAWRTTLESGQLPPRTGAWAPAGAWQSVVAGRR